MKYVLILPHKVVYLLDDKDMLCCVSKKTSKRIYATDVIAPKIYDAGFRDVYEKLYSICGSLIMFGLINQRH